MRQYKSSVILSAIVIFVALAGFAGTQPVPAKPFPRGAVPTPFSKIIASLKTGKSGIYTPKAPPPQIITVPKKLSMWGNDQYGDCVTAESVFSIADYSTFTGIDEIFVTDAVTISWANKHGYLNGAMLLDVMQDMGRDGIVDEKGVLRKAGTPSSVDFSNEDTLRSAIAQGPLSIAIDANALPSGAGNKSGWYAFGGRSYPNTDHCVSLCGYGPAKAVFEALGVPLPSGIDPNKIVYLLYTWRTIGVVDHAWLMNTCVESWVRTPTVVGLAPPPPQPPPVGNITVTVPNVSGAVGSPVKFTPSATGGTSPYIFLFEYGDGTQDAAGQHTYKTGGSWKANVTAVDSKGAFGQGSCVASIGVDPPQPPIPPNPPTPIPVSNGTITWTINGVTSQYELFPVGTRKQGIEIFGPLP